jgi:release factor glutamine methyltransferase
VFKPHSDSLMLAEHVGRERHLSGAGVLDLCAGSGVLAITAALCGASRVTAVDVSFRAMLAIRLNARLNGVSVRAVRGDLYAPVAGQRFGLIVSNPPYVPSPNAELPARGASRAWEAGPRGRAFIDRICAGAPSHLDPGGVLLLIHSSFCSEEATAGALADQGLDVRVVARSRGPLGRLGRARAEMLRQRGLLVDGDTEEILIFRAQRA